MKFKSKRCPIPKEELVKVDERADGKCEYHGDDGHCVGKLVYAHIIHRGMGGVQGNRAMIINGHRNIVKICEFTHDFIDRRIFDWKRNDGYRKIAIDILKQKIGWYEWYKENASVISR
jgi:hypothetical protein